MCDLRMQSKRRGWTFKFTESAVVHRTEVIGHGMHVAHAQTTGAVTRMHTYLAEVVERYAESDALLAVRIHHLCVTVTRANRCSDCV